MARYPLNLPDTLKRDAQQLADREGVSLNQLILWAVAEKVASLRETIDDSEHAGIAYRRGAGGPPVPVLRGTGIRVLTLYTAVTRWGLSEADAAAQWGLSQAQVKAALAFATAHRGEMESAIEAEEKLAQAAER